MKVSIVTATYNSSKTVGDTLTSVQNQIFSSIEHIIVDGNSKDDTLSVLEQFGHRGPLVSEPDNGIYDAMNKGIKIATGDIVGILNSDDFYPNNEVIQKVVDIFSKTNCEALYGDLLYVDEKNTKKIKRKWIAGPFSKKQFYRGWMPPHPTFFVKREVYDKFGLFNTQLKSAADYELLLRFIFINRIKTEYLPEVLVHMRAGGQSNSSLKNRIAAHMEDRAAWKINQIRPKWFTLMMKPMRKIKQFIFPTK